LSGGFLLEHALPAEWAGRIDVCMGRITTHVLDTAAGRPAAGLTVVLTRLDGSPQVLAETATNADGRCDRPLLEGAAFAKGNYEIMFHVGDYFRRSGVELPDPPFLDHVPLRFGVTEDAHYHVPLLVSPFGYSTYRGS
jgi:5-hydroxyisourate hydrolase